MSTLAVIELRRYTLRPGQRDLLIDLFDREFVESQEACGMRLLGQFRDLDDPDQFVWMRGFTEMAARPGALGSFYGGPVWKEHRQAANAAMIDSDNVLLLRPLGDLPPLDDRLRGVPTKSVVVAEIYRQADLAGPDIDPAGGTGLALLETESAENNFPALPVRSEERFVVALTSYPSEAEAEAEPRGSGPVAPVERLRLAPTLRSILR